MDGLPLADAATAGLAQNQCYPQVLVNDPSFALLNSDPYFLTHPGPDPRWANPPDAALINNRAPPFPNRKRDLPYLDPAMFVLDNGNVSRRPTPEELENAAAQYIDMLPALEAQPEELGYVDCRGDSCATQLTPLGGYVAFPKDTGPWSLTGDDRASIAAPTPARTAPSMVEAAITTAEPMITEAIYPS